MLYYSSTSEETLELVSSIKRANKLTMSMRFDWTWLGSTDKAA